MSEYYPIRDVFRLSLDDFLREHPVSNEQRRAALAIRDCKTGRLGFNSSVCEECGHIEIHSSSCRNRHCPNCQSVLKELWIDQRRGEVLDAKYFHFVFTVPHDLTPLFLANRKLLYSLLMQAASQTLLTLARDKRYLGATPGIILVLHTWGQNLSFHPHVHCIVSGAGLTRDLKLRKCGSGFFIPVRAASKMFRGKFMAALKAHRDSGELILPASFTDPADPVNWQCFVDRLYGTDWVAYTKETFNGYGNAINYLGRYTHRVAISNARILKVAEDTVSSWYRDYRDGYARKEMTLSHEEFIRRFLMHILPKGFQKIRYFGFLSNPVKKKKLRILFRLQGYQTFKARFSMDTPKDVLLASLGIDVHTCPCCGKSAMRYIGRSFHARP